jgi:hypothetical protein
VSVGLSNACALDVGFQGYANERDKGHAARMTARLTL